MFRLYVFLYHFFPLHFSLSLSVTSPLCCFTGLSWV
jgi:hypothetical protein